MKIRIPKEAILGFEKSVNLSKEVVTVINRSESSTPKGVENKIDLIWVKTSKGEMMITNSMLNKTWRNANKIVEKDGMFEIPDSFELQIEEGKAK